MQHTYAYDADLGLYTLTLETAQATRTFLLDPHEAQALARIMEHADPDRSTLEPKDLYGLVCSVTGRPPEE